MSSIEKLTKIINVSNKIKSDMLRDFLEIDEKTFNKQIVEWAEKFNLTINGDEIIVNKEDIADFIQALEKQFEIWESGEKAKTEKINKKEKEMRVEEDRTVEKETFMSKSIQFTIQIVGAAIFAAISLILSLYVVPYLPRTPEGFAYFDPVSIIWVTCFLIFGRIAGILCTITGSVLLFPFDPFSPIGPLMKLAATFSLIIVPILLLSLKNRKRKERLSQIYKKPRTYIIYSSLGVITRIIVMVMLNIIVYLTFYGPEGLEYWVMIVILLNSLTSLWDLLVPYLIVFGTKLDEKFEIW
ncbi:MAG: hypothetical protein ACFFC3_10780 [Candidatus Odinarchaeota archaeon]